MKRKLLSLCMVLALCLGLVPASALAASGGGSCGAGVSWNLDEAGTLTISGSGPMDDFAASAWVPWYDLRGSIFTIQVSQGVTHIGANAFLNCLSVTSVQIADSVASIGDSAFSSCGSPTNGPRIHLPGSMTAVGSYTFMGCNLTGLTIPAGVTTIGDHAFFGCGRLTEVSLPRTVAKIEANAFDGCSALTSVSLPEGVEIAHWAFHSLPASAAVSYGGTQAQWDAIGAAKGTTTAELVFGASGAAAPKVQVQSSTPAPGQPASLTLSGQMGSDGVVELSAANPKLSASVTAPVGAVLNSWELRLYTQSGSLITAITESRAGTIAQSPTLISMTLWKTPSGSSVVFSDFSLNLGTEYSYSFSAVINGESFTTERGRFRLGPVLRTYTVEFCNPVNMTYSKSIQVVSGQPYGPLPTPAPMAGRVFEGWFTNGGNRVTADTIANLTQNQTLYAHWSQEAPTTLTHTSVPGNGGIVELTAQNPQVTATLSAPVGKRLTRWDVNFYNTNGTFVGRLSDATGGVMSGTSAPLSMRLWTATGPVKAGQNLDYGTFRLTVGTVYDYEFAAVVEGQTYTSSRARLRLTATGQSAGVPAGGMAYTSTQMVQVDGRAMQFQMYALKDAQGNDTNYIRLRDLAFVLNGTRAQFDVGWNGSVNLETGRAYRTNGEEMSTPFSGNRTYALALAPTNVNGSPVHLTAILLKDDRGGGYTYYQLRDLGRALGFQVGWKAGTGIFVETNQPYQEG